MRSVISGFCVAKTTFRSSLTRAVTVSWLADLVRMQSLGRNVIFVRDAKRCERCERCSCKDFPTGVKILVENFVKGGVNKCQVFVTTAGNHKCLCL